MSRIIVIVSLLLFINVDGETEALRVGVRDPGSQS